MDKLKKLGGTEVMHHRAAARPETGGEGEKARRGEEADHDGNRWQVAEKEDRGHPPHPRLVHGLDLGPTPNFRRTKWREHGKERGETGTWANELALKS